MTCERARQDRSTELDPRIMRVAERILPRFLLRRLDPIRAIIDSEIRHLASQTGESQIVLDAGAGEARHRAYFPRGRYVAVDSGTGDPGWDYSRLDVCGNLECLPLLPQSVDAILCIVVLEHTRHPREVLCEFARVLKPGGACILVVPFLWEEHQAPHDYFRFTRYGMETLFGGLPFHLEVLDPMGGFFWVCARRSVSLLSFFQSGWRRLLFPILAPVFGLLLPLLLYSLDGLDHSRHFTLGFRIRALRTDKP